MKKYLISACLVGENVRYDAKNCLQHKLKQLLDKQQAVVICPEVSGGLSTPRQPAEIVGGDGYQVLKGQAKVKDANGHKISGKGVTVALLEQHGFSPFYLLSLPNTWLKQALKYYAIN
ncbi:unnamed protein product [Oppiella nova]|uniref:DUF523 domain-containing protein n=1 Tax=Oppiella nova TaxID=334625 RepID=A0A7R9L7M2_9ACAR|nr:unnamed protein product [Oppiella nova]CAG2157409.1 unnamed protein product [Oppiella nova]